MITKNKFFPIFLFCWLFVYVANAASFDLNSLISDISNQTSINAAIAKYNSATQTIKNAHSGVDSETIKNEEEKVKKHQEQALNSVKTVSDSAQEQTISDTSDLEAKQQAYDEAKATEQSKENRTLTALTTAATGIGGMQLAQGLAEQKADKAAEQDMSAYIATMRCSYADGKSVKAGAEEIELPGANDSNIMKYRAEYMALAADLKERKDALGMKPGIESEEIMDRAQMGLYDDENVGISDGAYASLYRAQMQNSDKDQQQIDADKKTSKTRVIAGGVAAGVGVVGGMVGDSLVNGKLGEKIKSAKESDQTEESTTTTK